MKKILLFLLGICLMTKLFAQAPQGIPYQSAMRNSSGGILANQSVSIRFSIHDSAITGAIVYQETHASATNSQGIVSLTIGQGTALIGSFAGINWGQHAKFLQVEMNVTAGSSYADLGTQQMMSVPYALYAGKAENGFSGSLPTVNTDSVYNIASPTALIASQILNDGGNTILLKGICWGTTSNPTISLNNKTNEGPFSGSFTSILSELLINTQYFVRSYAINSLGIAYGNVLSFITTASLPTLTTSAISNIALSSANCGGNISYDGGIPIIARGVCWSTTPNPTVSLSTKTLDGVSIGSFTSIITGLTPGNIYYARAYATNSVGTAYGNEITFTTQNLLSIGQNYQGGIIAYILQAGDPGFITGEEHGLIAAPFDQSTGIIWWNGNYLNTGATATAIGAGNANTNMIVSAQGTGNYAAKLCYDLTLNGYSDWYLPSKDELDKLNFNQVAIGASLNTYWSSSEYNSTVVWAQGFPNGNLGLPDKHTLFYVRAVRSF